MAEDAVARIGRPSWRDPRLGVGVLLVAVAIVLGSWAVSRAAETVDVFRTDTTLTPGDLVTTEDLRAQAVRPDGLEDGYLLVDAGVPPGAVVTRVVGAGELVPAAALGHPGDVEVRPVVVPVGPTAVAGVGKGGVVDLWWTPPPRPGPSSDDARPAQPELLSAGLVVAEVVESSSIFAGAGGSAVQVLVPQDELPAVLSAVGGEGSIVVVPVPGSGP